MNIQTAKEITKQALDKAFKAGVFNLVEGRNVVDALEIVLSLPEIESLGMEEAPAQSNEEETKGIEV